MGDCRTYPQTGNRNVGFTLVEVLIAGGLIAFIAVAVLPAFFTVVDSSKASGFKGQCTAAAHAKMQEYLNGVADTSVAGSTGYVPTGFEYTKQRYQQIGAQWCSLAPTDYQPGFRETVYGNQTYAPASANTVEWAPGSTNTPAVMQGFQLWVMLRHYNPSVVTSAGSASRDCTPNETTGGYSYYQFYRLGDAIEVTVTGFVRTDAPILSGGRGGAGVGKLFDQGHPNVGAAALTAHPNPLLTCSVTEIIYPPRVPFRYYLGDDGKIRNMQSAITFQGSTIGSTTIDSNAQSIESHFRRVWVQSGGASINTTVPVGNIRAFAVSPDNQWVYVLRPGELARYGPCYDYGQSVTVNGTPENIGGTVTIDTSTFLGTPDCPSVPSIATYANTTGPDGNVWSVSPAIESLAVDFGGPTNTSLGTGMSYPTSHTVYGLLSSSAVFSSGMNGLVAFTLPTSSPFNATWAESPNYTLPLSLPRMKGVYIAQTFTNASHTNANLFYYDNTCYAAPALTGGQSSYCLSLYNSADSNSQQTMRELPTQVQAISY